MTTMDMIEKYDPVSFFKGKTFLQRTLIIGYSWGAFSASIMLLLLLLPAGPFSDFEFTGTSIAVLLLSFCLVSPAFGLALNLLLSNKSLLTRFKVAALKSIAVGEVADGGQEAIPFPATVRFPWKGSYYSLVTLTGKEIVIDYFAGLAMKPKRFVIARPFKTSKFSLNPFSYLLLDHRKSITVNGVSIVSEHKPRIQEVLR